MCRRQGQYALDVIDGTGGHHHLDGKQGAGERQEHVLVRWSRPATMMHSIDTETETHEHYTLGGAHNTSVHDEQAVTGRARRDCPTTPTPSSTATSPGTRSAPPNARPGDLHPRRPLPPAAIPHHHSTPPTLVGSLVTRRLAGSQQALTAYCPPLHPLPASARHVSLPRD